MKRAFPWLFFTFSSAFLLFLITQFAVLVPGVQLALKGYETTQKDEYEVIARSILLNPGAEYEQSLRYANPFFVYSADGNLVYSNRGRGRSNPRRDLQSVSHNGAKIGYYYAGEMRFLDYKANRIFLTSLVILASVSVIASVILGLLLSFFASRRIARPVAVLQSDIKSLESRHRVNSRVFSITELTNISSSLETLSTIIADEEEYKRQWMQDIAHDLRTPVSGLKGQIEGMRDGVLEPNAERFAKNLREIDRLENLINGISDLYVAENVGNLHVAPFPALEFIEDILSPYEAIRQKKKINVKIVNGAGEITGERSLLVRALRNIVGNAFTYSPMSGMIRIIMKKAGKGVEIEITDDGPGIPADQVEKIFHRFYRGEYSRRSTGSGLGLNIAKTIIEKHGGSISAANIDSKGASFIVNLPLRSAL